MREYRLEIVEWGQVKLPAEIVSLPEGQAIWPSVEALALRMASSEGSFIQVSDFTGATLVRAGISTALASIENCPCKECILKRRLRYLIVTGRSSVHPSELVVECRVSNAALAA
jgi:hypothetical protein